MNNSNEINDTNGNAVGHGDENILDDLMQNSMQFNEDEKPAAKLNYLFRDARFFLVKSSVSENVSLSKVHGVWSTLPANSFQFNKAYKESQNVLLIYSVKKSGKFCGLARLATESRRDGPRVPWILPPGLPAKALDGVFKIDWICKRDLPFTEVSHLHNLWNEKNL